MIQTSNAEIEVLGTRLALSNQNEVSEIGVNHGRVRVRRLSDGQTIELEGGQYTVASRHTGLQAKSWPAIADTWNEDFEAGLPEDWRYGQWLSDGLPDGSRGAVRASRRSSLEGIDSNEYRITLPKRWTRGLWEIHEDSQLSMTYKMSHPGWFQIMMGVRSDDLDPSYVGNYELQSSYWPKAAAKNGTRSVCRCRPSERTLVPWTIPPYRRVAAVRRSRYAALVQHRGSRSRTGDRPHLDRPQSSTEEDSP